MSADLPQESARLLKGVSGEHVISQTTSSFVTLLMTHLVSGTISNKPMNGFYFFSSSPNA